MSYTRTTRADTGGGGGGGGGFEGRFLLSPQACQV